MSNPHLAAAAARTRRSLRGPVALLVAPLALASLGALTVGAFAGLGFGARALPGAPLVDVPKEAVGAYDVDPVHSTVAFKIKHVGVSYQLGRFNKFSGEVKLGATPAESSVSIAIDPATVDTNNEQRDQHLRSQDFLNVKQFPEAKFTSTEVAAKDAHTYTVKGDLELHGVKKSVAFDMLLVGARDAGAPMGYKAGFFGSLTIDRRDFGMDKYPDEMLDGSIELTFAIECNKRK